MEVLAEVRRINNGIKRITVNGREIKISHYADRLQTQTYFRRSFLSPEKVPCKTNSEEKLCPEIELKWMKDKVKTSGLWLSTDAELTMEATYDEKLTKLKASMDCWELR